MIKVNLFPNENLDSYKLKDFTEDDFKFDENGRKISEMINTLWEKKKLLVTSNVFFSHSVFKRPVLQTRKIKGLVWERVKWYKLSLSTFHLNRLNIEGSALLS